MGREATSAMSDFDRVAWFPLCAGLTGLGLVGSWVALRRRGVGAGLRGAAWSLLPLAAYLTGVVALLWRVGTALVDWVGGFVLSPTVWAGVAVTAFAALLFAVSGMLRRRAACRAAAAGPGRPEPTGAPSTVTTGMTSRVELDVNASSAPARSSAVNTPSTKR